MAYETRYCSHCANPLQWITAAEDGGDVARLRCSACGWTHWGNPTPVLAAVVEGDDGRVLLARNAQWQEGVFGLITGFMEAGESPGSRRLPRGAWNRRGCVPSPCGCSAAPNSCV